MTGIVFATNVSASRVAARLGARLVTMVAALLAAAACVALLPTGPETPYVAMVAQMVVLGAAVGLVVPLITSELLGSVDRSRAGVASGTLNTLRQTGSLVGVALLASLPGPRAAFAVAAGLLAACAAFARGLA
jgi:DHA2 family methylenomycin A resistance protein-like MFS transporter